MNRNNNRKIVTKLAQRGYQTNPSRNIVAIVAIALTTMMFTTVFSLGFSLLDSMAALGVVVGSSDYGSQGVIIGVAALGSILISGHLIISNIFETSVTQDIQHYGLLKTIGATKSQIRRLIRKQALRLCQIGIPLGLLIGFLISMVVVPMVLVSFEAKHVVSLNPLIFIGAVLFSLITVLFSTNKPAKVAGKVSPMQALSFVTVETQAMATTKKTQGEITPKSMAKNNLMRNKKLNFRVILSITLGLTLMNTFYVYQNSYDEETYVASFIGSDVAVQAVTGTLPETLLPELRENKDVVDSGQVHYIETDLIMNQDVKQRLVDYYEKDDGPRSWLEGSENGLKQYNQLRETGETKADVFGTDAFTDSMGNVYYGNLDEEKFQQGNYVIAFGIANNGEGSVHYQTGDQIEIAGKNYELMAMMDPKSTLLDLSMNDMEASAENELEVRYMISEANFKDSFSEGRIIGTFADTRDGASRNQLAKDLKTTFPDQQVSSKESFQLQFQAQVFAQVILGYTLGIIMAVIGILNFVNAMLTAIMTRKREFAVLESIGMTKQQIKQMLIYEGLSYGTKAIGLSLILSIIVANTWVAQSVSESWVAAYHFSLAPFIIIIPLILLLAYQVPMAFFKETQKKSLVERLRETS